MANESVERKQIGTATMAGDGTIILKIATQNEGFIACGTAIYKTDDPHYWQVLSHLGLIMPGQSCAVTEFTV